MEQLKLRFPKLHFVEETTDSVPSEKSMLKTSRRSNKNAAGNLRAFTSIAEFRSAAKAKAAEFFARYKPTSV